MMSSFSRAMGMATVACLIAFPSFASGFREATLLVVSDFDLETARSGLPGKNDLNFGCGSNEEEYLRALPGVKWASPYTNNFAVGASGVKAASFSAPKHASGYPDIFHLPASAANNLIGKVYFIWTAEGNFARLRVAGFDPAVKQPKICRNLKIQYEVFHHGATWGSCSWLKVGAKKTHQTNWPWCQGSTFLTQFDLDGETNLDAHDAPIVGQAECCNLALPAVTKWELCSWFPVGPQKSHQKGSPWCPTGSFITQVDFDGDKNFSAHDTPIVGQVKCCTVNGNWGSCYWVEVGPFMSHQPHRTWCPNGTFLTQFDLDSENKAKAHDSPIVGRARCCSLLK